MLKAVLDTSVFVAGYLSRTGKGSSAQIISRWRAGEFELIMSRQILEEIVEKFLEKGIDDGRILEFVEVIGLLALNIPGTHIVYRLDDIDPDDNILLAAAQEGNADYLVSLDARHVLPLNHHRGTQIVNPVLFLRALDNEQGSMPEASEETDRERPKRLIKEEPKAIRKERKKET